MAAAKSIYTRPLRGIVSTPLQDCVEVCTSPWQQIVWERQPMFRMPFERDETCVGVAH